METMTENAENIGALYPWAGEIADRLLDCWIRHGRPAESAGPSTDVAPPIALIDDVSIYVGEGGEDFVDAEKYNAPIRDLCGLLGYVHVGGGSWRQQYNSSEDWRAYVDDAREILLSWIAYDAWEEFINSNSNSNAHAHAHDRREYSLERKGLGR